MSEIVVIVKLPGSLQDQVHTCFGKFRNDCPLLDVSNIWTEMGRETVDLINGLGKRLNLLCSSDNPS